MWKFKTVFIPYKPPTDAVGHELHVGLNIHGIAL